MHIEFDPVKSARNMAERALPFDRVASFDFSTAIMAVDGRRDDAEVRYVAVGLLDGRVHVLCFTPVADGIRVISFRKANRREVMAYEQARHID